MSTRQREMSEITKGLPTKSEKIRRLGARGYTRQQIADFLGIRYQHVRNVLIDAERKESQHGAPAAGAETRDFGFEEGAKPFQSGRTVITHIDVGQDGSLTISADVLAAAGFKPSDGVTMLLKGEGRIEVLSVMEGIKHAQDLVAHSTRPGVSLVDELFKMRREEAEKEEREYRELQERLSRR